MSWKFMGLMCLVAILTFSAGADANLDRIVLTLAYGGASSFDAQDPLSSSELQWSSGAGAIVYKENGTYFTAADSNIDATFSTMTDASSGGVASARFGSGTWSVKLTSADGQPGNNYEVLRISGTVDWYDESETDTDELTGSGIVTPTSFWFDSMHGFFSSAQWGWGSDHKSAVLGLTTGLSSDIDDYTVDFTGNNLSVVIYADSSAIPEPATMLMLCAGGLGLMRRRKG